MASKREPLWRRAYLNRNMICAVVWLLLLIPALIWWKNSVLFVIVASVYANWKTDVSAHHALKARPDAE